MAQDFETGCDRPIVLQKLVIAVNGFPVNAFLCVAALKN